VSNATLFAIQLTKCNRTSWKV